MSILTYTVTLTILVTFGNFLFSKLCIHTPYASCKLELKWHIPNSFPLNWIQTVHGRSNMTQKGSVMKGQSEWQELLVLTNCNKSNLVLQISLKHTTV